MSPASKREYVEAIFLRYKRASRNQKTVILNEFCSACGYHRKYAIRLLRKFKRFTKPKKKKRGRKPVYDKEAILLPLKRMWLAANLPCSKRLKAILGTLLRKQIPIKTNQWDESRPGFLEADTVAHCGESLMASLPTRDCVDIATGWTEQRAVWGKGEHDVMEQIKDIEKSLPFPLLGFDSDNGSEFLNYHLLRHFSERKKPVQFTRSRAYHKDDNAHIEQKNWTHVRQWLGYHRMDCPDVISLLNCLYKTEWRLFHNFFCPSVKLIAKQRIASKTIKRYDDPKTPFQRVLESPLIDDGIKQNLKEQFLSLNPFNLRKAMEIRLKKVFELCCKAKL